MDGTDDERSNDMPPSGNSRATLLPTLNAKSLRACGTVLA
jgi:hypothetical protein